MRNPRMRTFARRLTTLAFCAAALCAAPVFAQGGGMGGGMRGQMSPEGQKARMDSMVKAVGLSDDQVVKIKALNADSMKQMMELRESGGDPQEMRPKMMAIRQAENAKVEALLTEDQKPKYTAWLASQPRPGRPGAGGGRSQPPPPQP
jgi:protein CpxP